MSISAIPSGVIGSPQFRPTQTPFPQDFQKLGQDLQSGNLSAAQKDFATLQNDIRDRSGADLIRHFHHLRAHIIFSEGTAGSTGPKPLPAAPPTEPPTFIGGGRFTTPPVGAPPSPRFIGPPISFLA